MTPDTARGAGVMAGGQPLRRAVNARQASGVNLSAGLSAFLESRTMIVPGRVATSTQLLPWPTEYDDFRHIRPLFILPRLRSGLSGLWIRHQIVLMPADNQMRFTAACAYASVWNIPGII